VLDLLLALRSIPALACAAELQIGRAARVVVGRRVRGKRARFIQEVVIENHRSHLWTKYIGAWLFVCLRQWDVM